MSKLTDHLARHIAKHGPIPVADYMEQANAFYYATRDPLGRKGDFITAPEISQMFGELIGLWLADLWLRAGKPARACYAELGPGRGTLAADALRAMRAAGLEPQVHFVETSPLLRKAQKQHVPNARWHDAIATLPIDAPLFLIANEFFDALPVHQYIAAQNGGWRELVVGYEEKRFVRLPGPIAPLRRPAAKAGTVVETSPASTTIMRALARRICTQGGAILVFDYGPLRSGTGDTLQAVRAHQYADPWVGPGTCDLTAHVDFAALGEAAAAAGAGVFGPVPQGQWLRDMGIEERTRMLIAASPAREAEIAAARDRLTAPEQMGALFKAMAIVAPSWPEPAGFA